MVCIRWNTIVAAFCVDMTTMTRELDAWQDCAAVLVDSVCSSCQWALAHPLPDTVCVRVCV